MFGRRFEFQIHWQRYLLCDAMDVEWGDVQGESLTGMWAEDVLHQALLAGEGPVLREAYAALCTGVPQLFLVDDHEVLRHLYSQLGNYGRLGWLALVELPDEGDEATAAEEVKEPPSEAEQVAAAIEAASPDDLVHSGRRYLLMPLAAFRAMTDRHGLEVLDERETRGLIEAMAADSTRSPELRALLAKVAGFTTRARIRQPRDELVLLRREHIVLGREDKGAAITPSQMRRLQEVEWIEIELVDERDGPLVGTALVLTAPNEDQHHRTTDAEGRVRLDHIVGGEYRVSVRTRDGQGPAVVETTWDRLEQGVPVASSATHRFEVDHNKAELLEVDAGQFLAGSSVLLPMPHTRAARHAEVGLCGISIAAQALRYAEAHADRVLLIAGHADGSEAESLSSLRADNLHALLLGDATAWAAACHDPEQRATPHLLRWAHARHGYDCDPDEDRAEGPDDTQRVRDALSRFRRQHSARTDTTLDDAEPKLVTADYEALFSLYERSLADLCDVEPEDLGSLRASLQWHGPAVIGCGDNWSTPADAILIHLRGGGKRRADLIFFEKDRPIPAVDATSLPAEQIYANNHRMHCAYVEPELPPPVTCVRMTGMYFDTNKSFLFPCAMEGMRKLVELYEAHSTGELLIVGHTDTSGEAAYNAQLSLERAQAVAAYLKDDVDTWLKWYDKGVPIKKRWGKAEDDAMLGALPDASEHRKAKSPLKSYQQSRGLGADGIIGPKTRRQLITDYMDLDATTLPEGLTPVAHGCGEYFPLIDTGDGQNEARNRRVELFLFEDGIKPPPAGETSAAGSEAYAAWRRRVVRTIPLERTAKFPRQPVFVVTPYTRDHIEMGIDAEFTLVGGSYSQTLKVSEHRSHVADYFGEKYIELEFENVPAGGYYSLVAKPKDGEEYDVLEGVPFEKLVDDSHLDEPHQDSR